jgi:hypothetical protein
MAGEKVKRRKRRPRKPDDPAQYRRFLEAAKKLGAENGEAFNRALDKIVPKKPKTGSN